MESRAFSTRRDRGFTLIEVLISAGLSGLILIGILTCVLMIGRSAANNRNYTEIEATARKALETISRDVHVAYAIKSLSATNVDLAIPDATSFAPTTPTTDLTNYPDGYLPAYYVEYTYNSGTKSLSRIVRDNTHNNPVTTVLLTNVQTVPGLSSPDSNIFHYYRYINTSAAALGSGYVNGPPIPIGSPGNNEITSYSTSAAVQQIEVKFYLVRQSTTVAAATNKVLSARFILRNKR